MKRYLLPLLILIAGCGGGGPSGITPTATMVGRIIDVSTGGPPSPAASIQVGGNSAVSSLSDGSFSLDVPQGTTQAQVNQITDGIFTFNTSSITGTTDVGDLWIGPQKVTLHGVVTDGATNAPVAGATVFFAGKKGTTAADGSFDLTNVAYANANQAAFWGIVGTVQATNYIDEQFTAGGFSAIASVVDIGTVFVTQQSSITPPPPPFDISGKVIPGIGTVVTLSQSGSAVRVVNVGSDGTYSFWVPAGTYSIAYANGALTAPNQPVTVVSPSTPIHIADVTLH